MPALQRQQFCSESLIICYLMRLSNTNPPFFSTTIS